VIYTFIETEKENHRISRMCKLLRVSKSGFYSWRDREPSARAQADALLAEKILRIHRDSRETYGAPRIHFELRTLGVRCARKRVARLMREAGLFGCGGRRRKARTTLRSRTERTPRLRTWCSATSPPRPRIGCGLRTSHTSEAERDGSISRSCWTPTPGRSSDGLWRTT
jgi:transposase InsO family protein